MKTIKLEDIGFYTLSDERAMNVTQFSRMQRCELILTDRCNFNCLYCRGIEPEYQGDLTFNEATNIVDKWVEDGLKNIRFSGGEPTMWKNLTKLVAYSKLHNIERIAISTNGSASKQTYLDLINAGANDFSVSLDTCCAAEAGKMAGCPIVYDNILSNIKMLAQKVYTTIGVVINEDNISSLNDTIQLISDLNVHDIRIISAAQYNKSLIEAFKSIPQEILNKYPILKYRTNNAINNRNVRGISDHDTNRCSLVLDDSAILANKHFPCIIYLREGGAPIGNVGTSQEMREQRAQWSQTHDTHKDPICKQNCLDVCIDYNNKVANKKYILV